MQYLTAYCGLCSSTGYFSKSNISFLKNILGFGVWYCLGVFFVWLGFVLARLFGFFLFDWGGVCDFVFVF